MNLTYLFIDISAVLIPLLFSFHPKIQFYKAYRSFWPGLLSTAVIFIIWDILFTQLKVWGFNQKYLCGLYVFNLPIEEILFFICIPYACVFTYYCVKKMTSFKVAPAFEKLISGTLFIGLFTIGIYSIQKLYTGTTFLLLGSLIFILSFISRVKWLGKFYLVYLFLLLPFLIVNGILTGSFIDEPIVWYNDAENLSLRFFTIPLEDTFYGLLMILMNVTFFETFMKSGERIPSIY